LKNGTDFNKLKLVELLFNLLTIKIVFARNIKKSDKRLISKVY